MVGSVRGMAPSAFALQELVMALNKDALLVVKVFQQAGIEQSNPSKYVKLYKDEIKDTFLLFEYLLLAERDKTSPLDWKPTDHLLKIIENGPSKKKADLEFRGDVFMLDLLNHIVFGEDERRGDFALQVLNCLGLLKENESGRKIPTLQLRNLFLDGYWFRRLERDEAARLGAG
jgi:hypothetical protein